MNDDSRYWQGLMTKEEQADYLMNSGDSTWLSPKRKSDNIISGVYKRTLNGPEMARQSWLSKKLFGEIKPIYNYEVVWVEWCPDCNEWINFGCDEHNYKPVW